MRKKINKNYNKIQHNLIGNLKNSVDNLAKILNEVAEKVRLNHVREKEMIENSPMSSTWIQISPILERTPTAMSKNRSLVREKLIIEDNFIITFDSDFISESASSLKMSKLMRENEYQESLLTEKETTRGVGDQSRKDGRNWEEVFGSKNTITISEDGRENSSYDEYDIEITGESIIINSDENPCHANEESANLNNVNANEILNALTHNENCMQDKSIHTHMQNAPMHAHMQYESTHTHMPNRTRSGDIIKSNANFNFNIAVNNKYDVLQDFNTTKAIEPKVNSPSTEVKYKNKNCNNLRVYSKNSRNRTIKSPILNKTLENILTFVDKKYKESLNDFKNKTGAEDNKTNKLKTNRIRRTDLNKTKINKLTLNETKFQINIYKEKKRQYVNRMADIASEKEELVKLAKAAQATLAKLEARMKEIETKEKADELQLIDKRNNVRAQEEASTKINHSIINIENNASNSICCGVNKTHMNNTGENVLNSTPREAYQHHAAHRVDSIQPQHIQHEYENHGMQMQYGHTHFDNTNNENTSHQRNSRQAGLGGFATTNPFYQNSSAQNNTINQQGAMCQGQETQRIFYENYSTTKTLPYSGWNSGSSQVQQQPQPSYATIASQKGNLINFSNNNLAGAVSSPYQGYNTNSYGNLNYGDTTTGNNNNNMNHNRANNGTYNPNHYNNDQRPYKHGDANHGNNTNNNHNSSEIENRRSNEMDHDAEQNEAKKRKMGGGLAINTSIVKLPTSTAIRVTLDSKPNNYTTHSLFHGLKNTFAQLRSIITISITTDTTFIIKGINNQDDFTLLTNKGQPQWPSTLWGVKVTRLKILYDDEPTLMLSGKIVGSARDAIDLDGEKALVDNYGVQSIKKRGKKRYDVLFSTEKARNEALGYKRLQAGGVGIEVEEWKRIVRLDPCWKCWRVGHEPRECTAGYLLCRYCGIKNTHDSRTCPYKYIESLHMCAVCNNKKGHFACDRDKCPYYIKSYKDLCDSLKVSAPEKILAKTANLAYADGCSNMLMLFKHCSSNPLDFTKTCEKFMDADTMDAYKEKRDAKKVQDSQLDDRDKMVHQQKEQQLEHQKLAEKKRLETQNAYLMQSQQQLQNRPVYQMPVHAQSTHAPTQVLINTAHNNQQSNQVAPYGSIGVSNPNNNTNSNINAINSNNNNVTNNTNAGQQPTGGFTM
jgi:hypothetical protein